MLFISCSTNLQVLGIRKTKILYHPTSGEIIDEIPPIGAEFFHGGAPNWAIEQAIEHPRFIAHWTGLPPEQERRAMVSSYDTDAQAELLGWDDETKAFVEDKLLKNSLYGDWFIRAIPPEEVMALPWPSYDSTHHMQVAKIAEEIGVDLEYVIKWEVAHKNRDYVLRSLQEALDKTPIDAPVAA